MPKLSNLLRYTNLKCETFVFPLNFFPSLCVRFLLVVMVVTVFTFYIVIAPNMDAPAVADAAA